MNKLKTESMKKIKVRYISTLLSLILLLSCEENVENPTFESDALPRIFGWSASNAYTTNLEDSIVLIPEVSPSDGATYKWYVDDVEVASTKRLEHKFTEARDHTIEFVVERNGVVNSRQAQVLVIKNFEPKSYNKKMIGFISRTGELSDINFNNLTHLVISSAIVGEVEGRASLVDTSFTEINIPLIVKAAHNAGVYVMIDVTGSIIDLTGSGMYADYGFYNVIKEADKRDAAIATIMKFAEDNGLDGINIYLNNTSEGPDALDQSIVEAFYRAIPPALPNGPGPEGEFFFTASAPGGWTTGALKTIAQVEEIDWVHLHPFRYEDLAPTPHSPVWALGDLAATWESFGMPKEKIIPGFPAFGLHYFFPDDGTVVGWGNLWMYTAYLSYQQILTLDSEAHTKSMLAIDDGIYYDGHAVVQQKAQRVIDVGYGGLMMWGVDSDTQDQTKSLLKVANTALGN
jgi:hypothetical protein